ncbi:MAG TPA: cold shock domain-containing protein [Bacteroidia bacterium]|jgi:CspA family cold shock protein|nr:cold shock domain-containing protein [Bacteroidia bacterium]
MHTGIVKFFNVKNKFGFIVDDQTKKEYYVHVKDVTGEIKQGDRVSFELEEAAKGPQCANVKKIE